MTTLLPFIELLARAAALGAGVFVLAVAAVHWAVRHRHLQPFSAPARLTRQLSDPLLRPIERRLVVAGHNPQTATTWLVVIVLVAATIFLAFVRWLLGFGYALLALRAASPTDWIRFGLDGLLSLIAAALIARAVASWLGVPPWSRLLRPAVVLTEWLVAPIRRRIPPVGMIDPSPLVAYGVLLLVRTLVFALL